MTPRQIVVGQEFYFYDRPIRVTELKENSNGIEMVFDVLSDDLFREVIGWSFWQFWNKNLDEEIV